MTIREDVFQWVLAGKQVGATSRAFRSGETHWTSVGVQAWHGRFCVYVDEIAESRMDSEDYAREELLEFDELELAARYVDEQTQVAFEVLRPCKGQKIFNPEAQVPTSSPRYIGMAQMDVLRNVIVDLEAQHKKGATGIGRLFYSPSHPEYDHVLKHLGGLLPGEQKPVLPWKSPSRAE